jgi:hypothetical protein
MAWPTSVSITNLEFLHDQPTLITRSLNGYESRAQISTPKWILVADFENLTSTQRKDLQNFLFEVNGALDTFDFPLPYEFGGYNTAGFDGTMTTVGDSSIGDTSVSVSASANSTALLKKGDFVRFSGENKTYLVTEDVTSSGVGTATINIAPALLTAVSGSTTVQHKDVNMNVRFDGNQFSFNTDPTLYSSFNLTFVEVF